MQFSLRTLLILMAIICVYCGSLNLPGFISFPLYCSLACLVPAFWITGVIYSQGSRRAFFIGGLSTGTVPFVAFVIISLVFLFDGPWRWGVGYRDWDEAILVNLIFSLYIFTPVLFSFIGAWLAVAVYHFARSSPASSTPRLPLRKPLEPAEVVAAADAFADVNRQDFG